MNKTKRPYLIVPKLIEQPTWGGNYIIKFKGWGGRKDIQEKKVGQSYELFSRSKLLIKINSTLDPGFCPEIGVADRDSLISKTGYKKNVDYFELKEVTRLTNRIPLIKINQSIGNSFQIHIKESVEDKRWRPKLESCYYLEDGMVTYGIKKGIDVENYKKACLLIEEKMKILSAQIKKNDLTLEQAKSQSKEYIAKINPWQFVNVHHVKKDTIGIGLLGVQHSWEEDKKFPLGLVNLEVQQDVMDPVSTIRSFDKGKFKNDGSIREIHVEDYFKYLDTDPVHNDLKKMTPVRKGERLLTTKYFSLDIIKPKKISVLRNHESFSHLFIREGSVEVIAEDGIIFVSKGHSCFIPENVLLYKIKPMTKNTVVLKTTI